MAKNKKDKENIDEAPLDFTTAILNKIKKEYGEGICSPGSNIVDRPPKVISVSPAIDAGLQGGILEGSWISLSGPEGCGKTTTAMKIAAEAQKPENGSRHVYFFPVEGRLKSLNMKGTKGLKYDEANFTIIGSTEDKILTAEDNLDIAEKIIHANPRAVLIFDSISALLKESAGKERVGKVSVGGNNKVVTDFCDRMCNVVPLKRIIFIGIVHTYAKIGGMGGVTEKSAQRFKYQCDTKMRTTWAEKWSVGSDEDAKQIGQKIHWVIEKTGLGSPRKCVSMLRYGVGVDDVMEMIDIGLDAGLIDKAGAWYSFDGQKAQGAENLWIMLNENPEMYQKLVSQYKTMLGA